MFWLMQLQLQTTHHGHRPNNAQIHEHQSWHIMLEISRTITVTSLSHFSFQISGARYLSLWPSSFVLHSRYSWMAEFADFVLARILHHGGNAPQSLFSQLFIYFSSRCWTEFLYYFGAALSLPLAPSLKRTIPSNLLYLIFSICCKFFRLFCYFFITFLFVLSLCAPSRAA